MGKAIKFIKDNLLSILVSCAVIAFLLNVFFSVSIEITRSIGMLLFLAAFTERRKTWTIKQYQLKNKGLTQEDISNIQFVKKWEETREKGIWRYCIIDGGIIFGAYLWLIISAFCALSSLVKLQTIANAPENMFRFIGYSYIAGIIIGVIIYRMRWPRQEHRFKRLTDPINQELVLRGFYD
jgi:hypothetical protein